MTADADSDAENDADDDADDDDLESLLAQLREDEPRPASPDGWLVVALHRAARAAAARYRNGVRELGLTFPQLLVLACLWEQDSLPMSVLGERLGLSSATLSPLVTRLQAMGLVRREGTWADGRCVLVRLTDAGEELRRPGVSATTSAAAADGLDADERSALVTLLRQVEHSMRADGRWLLPD